jgi:hypothetical protein
MSEEGATPNSSQTQQPPPSQQQQNNNQNQQQQHSRNQNSNQNRNNNRGGRGGNNGGGGGRRQDRNDGAPIEQQQEGRQSNFQRGNGNHGQDGRQRNDYGNQENRHRHDHGNNQDGRQRHDHGNYQDGRQRHDHGNQEGRHMRRGYNQNYRNPNRQQNYRSKPASGFDYLIKSRKDHAGIPMTGNITDCLICCQPSDVFGVGECRHPVCMECCIRMRNLGESESCPQCRGPIALLYFVSAPVSWDNFTIPTDEVPHNDSSKYNIRFTSDYTVKCYDSYMAHSCQICAKNGDKVEFPTFGALRHHTAQSHQQTFCPICIDHLNVLSKDRHAYTKIDLDRHMKGINNELSGQKGHPPCLFCPERFFDDDHLYRHLRKEHYFCQICENDGGQNIFYPKIEELYSHYRKKHHPCTEPDCLAMGIVFKTDVELGVHKASEHGNSSRNVNIDFQFSGRNIGNRNPRNGAQQERDFPIPAIRQDRITVVPNNDVPAPSPLSASRIVPSAQAMHGVIVRSTYQPISRQDFPTLGPSAPPSSNTNTMPNWRQEVQAARQPQQKPQAPLQLNSGEQFPSLGGGSTSRVAPTQSKENFPSLSAKKNNNSSSAAANTVWGKGKPTALFKAQPAAPKPKPVESPRRKFIPLPGAWPEGMAERVEAMQKGEPDPGPSEPEPIDPLFRLEAAKKEKRKAAKKKSKTVPVSAFANRQEEDNIVQPSKFDALSELEETKNSKKNKAKKINYTLTPDNVVKIQPAPTLRSVAESIGEKKSRSTSEEDKPQQNGTKAPPPMAPPPQSSSSDISDFPALSTATSSFPSLTDIARGIGIWPLGRSSTQQASTQQSKPPSSLSTTSKNAWSNQPPPGFTNQPPPGFS